MDGADVRVMKRSEKLGFTLEPRHAIGIARDVGREGFNGDFPAQSRIARAPHLSHSPFSQGSDDFVYPEPGAWGECHG